MGLKEKIGHSSPGTFSSIIVRSEHAQQRRLAAAGRAHERDVPAVGHGEIDGAQDGAAVIRHGEVTCFDHALPPPFPRGVSARSTSRSSPTLSRMTASVQAKRSVVCRYSFDS